ncbi:MAG: pyridoxamine 5'-phosphate oxidase [Phycisphaerales bacterium]|nr:pyridoxamine 5'-phosphate oxidase [Phycisphaerales bacterium]
MDRPVSSLRREYSQRGLSEQEAGTDPVRLFDEWFDAAVKAGGTEPNAMALATVRPDGSPAVRTVLLKGYDERGFVFYTDYASTKGDELAANPRASVCFWWESIERQVRIEGVVEKVSAEESDAYFSSRPRESQLGAWASRQSKPLPDRETLEEQLIQVQARFGTGPIQRPPTWGGYRIIPTAFEFWQGRPHRLHDRFRFEREPGQPWQRTRLSP